MKYIIKHRIKWSTLSLRLMWWCGACCLKNTSIPLVSATYRLIHSFFPHHHSQSSERHCFIHCVGGGEHVYLTATDIFGCLSTRRLRLHDNPYRKIFFFFIYSWWVPRDDSVRASRLTATLCRPTASVLLSRTAMRYKWTRWKCGRRSKMGQQQSTRK